MTFVSTAMSTRLANANNQNVCLLITQSINGINKFGNIKYKSCHWVGVAGHDIGYSKYDYKQIFNEDAEDDEVASNKFINKLDNVKTQP